MPLVWACRESRLHLLSHANLSHTLLHTQDLAVVVLLMLIPLLAPSPDPNSGGMAAIATALGTAAVKVWKVRISMANAGICHSYCIMFFSSLKLVVQYYPWITPCPH